MLVTSWQLWEPRLDHENIVKESGLICAAWKWLGEKEVRAAWIDPERPDDDRALIGELYDVLSAADVLVAHNGDEFDLVKFRARAIFHGLPPIPPIPTIDTLKIARKEFKFNSNRLDYLGNFLGIGRKIPTSFKLWLKVMAGDPDALETMVRYNKQDVRLLERVYLTLRPYIKNHPNENLFGEVECCPTCGSKHFTRRGFKAQRTTRRQQYQCSKCGAWFCGKTEKTVVLR
jgi:hypothetical protein